MTLPDVAADAASSDRAARVRDAAPKPRANVDKFVEFYERHEDLPDAARGRSPSSTASTSTRAGEFVSLIGHSGCGKSTVLSMVAGLTDVSGGGIVLDGREIDGPAPTAASCSRRRACCRGSRRAQNVRSASIACTRTPPARSAPTSRDHYLARVGLARCAGQARRASSRTACSSASASRARSRSSPKLLLLDEPFGMLDSLTRWELQEVLMELWTRDAHDGDLSHARRRRGDPARRPRRDDDERPAREDRQRSWTSICRGRARARRCSSTRTTTGIARRFSIS